MSSSSSSFSSSASSSCSSFAPQVAAIMDVLAKAAVAEITKLVEDGAVELRMEVCRRDRELQDLHRSLQLLEAQLCRVREAAASRATEDKQQQTTEGTDEEVLEKCALYLEQKPADLLGPPLQGPEDRGDAGPVVKQEPADEPVTQETTMTMTNATTEGDASFETAARGEPVWPPPACRMFEKGAVPMQQQIQMFSPHTETFTAHRSSENSCMSSSSAAEETGDDSSSLPIKVEVDVRAICIGNTSADFVRKETFRPSMQPAVSQEHFLQSPSQQPGPSLAHRSTAGPNTDPHVFGRNNMRAKRQINVWRTNQKLFICSVCNKGFPRLSQLEEHKASHQPSKPFRCLKCGKSFTQKTRLKTHQSVHTGERPFSCKICGKMFSRHDNCLRHERFHSGLKPYSCGQCGKSFTVLGNLKIHQEIHLQGR